MQLETGRFIGTNLGSNSGGVALVFILTKHVPFTRKMHLAKLLHQELESGEWDLKDSQWVAPRKGRGRKPTSPLHGGHSLWEKCDNVHTIQRTN